MLTGTIREGTFSNGIQSAIAEAIFYLIRIIFLVNIALLVIS